MLRFTLPCLLAVLLASNIHSEDPKPDALSKTIEAELPDLKKLYEHLHANPELSLHEVQTSARIAEELKKAGFEVTAKFGGNGVIAVLKNGDGPTVWVRSDLDGLPITEKTGLPYASTVRTRDSYGNEVGVMHACGHDIHMTCLVGTARTLAAHKDQWAGTLVLVGQPAEEVVAGARAMLEAGMYTKFPKPDYALALHSDPLKPVGVISYSDGLAMANSDSVDIVVKGRGGHGASPHHTVDPIVLAARIILDLQTIVSREVNPLDPCVVTVGSIHGGNKHNIISNEVKLQLTVRTTKDDVRKSVLEAIERIAKAAAVGAKAPEPEVTVSTTFTTPALFNDSGLVKKTLPVLKELLGEANVQARVPTMGAEDFSRFSQGGTPIFMFFLGTISKERYEESKKPNGKQLPGMHTDSYAPEAEASVRVGVKTMSKAVMNLMPKK
jgi:hippurate hydrolase